MTMTRRGFLATSAGLLLSTLVKPAKRPLDLSAFCDPLSHHKYDLRSPFRQGDWLYATNSRTCVRSRPTAADISNGSAKLPPADGLPWWDHDRLRGWKPLRGEVLMVPWECPTCDGWGLAGNLRDCPQCDGEAALDCPCRNGVVGDRVCPDCNGIPVSKPVPGLVRIGGAYYAAHEVRKFQAAGECDYVATTRWTPHSISHDEPMRIRGDGFDGLLMPVDRTRAVQLVAEGKAT